MGYGTGPVMGICHDENYLMDALTLEKIVSTLAESPFAERKLSWSGFDAPFMSSAEAAAVLSPFAEYMIASPGTESMDGWNYLFLKGLEQDQNGNETAQRVLDTARENSHDFDLACTDLSLAP